MDKKLLGKRINTARKERGWTSERLSEACNINATYLQQIEAENIDFRRSAQCKRIRHSLILGAPIRKVGGIDGQHHARLFDDPLIGQKLGVRLLMEVDAVQFRASREHIEVALPKLRRPFGSLLLMGYDADQPKGLSFSRRILMISAVYSPTPGSQAT